MPKLINLTTQDLQEHVTGTGQMVPAGGGIAVTSEQAERASVETGVWAVERTWEDNLLDWLHGHTDVLDFAGKEIPMRLQNLIERGLAKPSAAKTTGEKSTTAAATKTTAKRGSKQAETAGAPEMETR